MAAASGTSSRGSEHRHLYVLIAGLAGGLLLGPHVLGRLNAGLYERLFVVGGQGATELAALRAVDLERQLRMSGAGTSEAGVAEFIVQADARRRARAAAIVTVHLDWLRARWHALVFAVLCVSILETRFRGGAEGVRTGRRGLATARHALLAVWLGLALAQPRLLGGVPVLFIALLVLVASLAALIPLGRRRA